MDQLLSQVDDAAVGKLIELFFLVTLIILELTLVVKRHFYTVFLDLTNEFDVVELILRVKCYSTVSN